MCEGWFIQKQKLKSGKPVKNLFKSLGQYCSKYGPHLPALKSCAAKKAVRCLAPGQKPKCDSSGLTMGSYKGFTWQAPWEKLHSPTTTLCTDSALYQGLTPPHQAPPPPTDHALTCSCIPSLDTSSWRPLY